MILVFKGQKKPKLQFSLITNCKAGNLNLDAATTKLNYLIGMRQNVNTLNVNCIKKHAINSNMTGVWSCENLKAYNCKSQFTLSHFIMTRCCSYLIYIKIPTAFGMYLSNEECKQGLLKQTCIQSDLCVGHIFGLMLLNCFSFVFEVQ